MTLDTRHSPVSLVRSCFVLLNSSDRVYCLVPLWAAESRKAYRAVGACLVQAVGHPQSPNPTAKSGSADLGLGWTASHHDMEYISAYDTLRITDCRS